MTLQLSFRPIHRALTIFAMIGIGAWPLQLEAQGWSTTDDYPARAAREGREGVTEFLVTIGVDGQIRDCSIIKSSGSQDLDEQTCKVLRLRAKFKPAVDEHGTPIEGTFRSKMKWKLSR